MAAHPRWARASSLEEAAKVVLAAEEHRIAWLIRRRLGRSGASIAQLAYAAGVGERQLKAKLAGRTRMQLAELIVWKWRLDDRTRLDVPDLAELLSDRAARGRPGRWPLPD